MRYVYLIVSTLVLFSCSAPDQNQQLEMLRKERAELDKKIAELEKTATGDTSGTGDKPIQVRVQQIEPVPFKTYVEIQGRVEAEENVALSTSIPGTVTKINVKEGARVNKGDVLAETDARATQQQLAAMQTSLSLVTQMYERQKNLWDQKIGTEMQYLQAKSGKEALESAVAALQEQLRMTRIISPIDGTVDAVNIKMGQAVAPGMPAVQVINFSDLKVEAEVAESYLSRVKTGNDVLVLFPDLRDSVSARVSYASRSIDPLTRTFKVEVNLDSKKQYHPNMVARLKINDYVSEKPAVVLPVKYIQRGLSENYVFVAEKGRVVKRVVKTGREYGGLSEIVSGLQRGDQLIVAGYDLVNDGDSVQVVTAEQTK